jgi:hypothetical protein
MEGLKMTQALEFTARKNTAQRHLELLAKTALTDFDLSLSKTLSGEDSPELWNRGMLAGDGCDPQAADRGATQLFYVARAARSGGDCSPPSAQHIAPPVAEAGPAKRI